MTNQEKFEEVFASYTNGQTKQWKWQMKKLTRGERADCLNYIVEVYDEDKIAYNMAVIIIGGEL